MARRYVLDGAPGSGKTTLLFGASDGAAHEQSLHTMVRLGYRCVHESVAQAHAILEDLGSCYVDDPALWLRTIAELDRDKFDRAGDGVTFYDRSFHHWRLLSWWQEIPLPEWYDREEARIRYESPVFLVAPIASVDLSGVDYRVSRRFTWEQRMSMHGELGRLYEGLGYRVVEVPVFHEGDLEFNNLRRIDHILAHVEGVEPGGRSRLRPHAPVI